MRTILIATALASAVLFIAVSTLGAFKTSHVELPVSAEDISVFPSAFTTEVVTTTAGYIPGRLSGTHVGDKAWSIDLGTLYEQPRFGVANGIAVFESRKDGAPKVHAIDAATGKALWSCEIGNRNELCAVEDESAFVRHDGLLSCIDIQTGKKVWSTDKDQKVVQAWTVPAGVLVNAGGKLQLYDRKNGTPQWKDAVTPTLSSFQVTASKQGLVIAGEDSAMQVFNWKNGELTGEVEAPNAGEGGVDRVLRADIKAGFLTADPYARRIEIVKPDNGEALAHWPIQSFTCWPVTDGKHVFALDYGLLRVFDAANLKHTAVRFLPGAAPRGLFLTDDAVVVTSSVESFVLNRSDLSIRQKIDAGRWCVLGSGHLIMADSAAEQGKPVVLKCYPLEAGNPKGENEVRTPATPPTEKPGDWSPSPWKFDSYGYATTLDASHSLTKQWSINIDHREIAGRALYPRSEGGPSTSSHVPLPLAATAGVLLSWSSADAIRGISESNGETQWSLELRLSEPVAVAATRGRFFVEAAGPSMDQTAVWCLDAGTGLVLWVSQFDAYPRDGLRPIVGDGVVVFGGGAVFREDTGELVALPAEVLAGRKPATLVAADSTTLYFVTAKYALAAWDVLRGDWRWEVTDSGWKWDPYFIGYTGRGSVYLPTPEGLTAYSAESGEIKWSHRTTVLDQPLCSGSRCAINSPRKISIIDLEEGRIQGEVESLGIHGTEEQLGSAKYRLHAMGDETLLFEWNGSIVTANLKGEAILEVENALFVSVGEGLVVMETPAKEGARTSTKLLYYEHP